jgi:hypothetical protein
MQRPPMRTTFDSRFHGQRASWLVAATAWRLLTVKVELLAALMASPLPLPIDEQVDSTRMEQRAQPSHGRSATVPPVPWP